MGANETEIMIAQMQRLEDKLDRVEKNVVTIQIASAKRDGRLTLVMAFFGLLGGAVADFVKRKFLG